MRDLLIQHHVYKYTSVDSVKITTNLQQHGGHVNSTKITAKYYWKYSQASLHFTQPQSLLFMLSNKYYTL